MITRIDANGYPVATGGVGSVEFPISEPADLYTPFLYQVVGLRPQRRLERLGDPVSYESDEPEVPPTGVTRENVEDWAAELLTDGTHTGITAAYVDADPARVDLTVTGAGITQEQAEDYAAGLLTNGSHSGITVAYQDTAIPPRLDLTVTGGGGSGGPYSSTHINVKDHGAVGNGTTDDYTALTAAITACPVGGVVYFPPGVYIVSQTLRLREGRNYHGADRAATTIRMAPGANLEAVAASEEWFNTNPTVFSNDAVNVERITFDGNKANQTSGTGHGLILISYYNHVHLCRFTSTRGSGLVLSSVVANGTTISNSAIETHIAQCEAWFTDIHGFHVNNAGATGKLTDGFMIENIVRQAGGDGILMGTGTGWLIEGNHLYGVRGNGITLVRPLATSVVNNYIEAWAGAQTVTQPVAGTYAAINCTLSGSTPWGLMIAGNKCNYDNAGPPDPGVVLRGIRCVTPNSTHGRYVITGNILTCTDTAGSHTGIAIANQGASSTTEYTIGDDNLIAGWLTPVSVAANGGVMRNMATPRFPTTLATTATDGFARVPSGAGPPTGTPADLTQGVCQYIDTTNDRAYFFIPGDGWRYAALT